MSISMEPTGSHPMAGVRTRGRVRLLNAVGSSVRRARYDYTAGVARIFDWGEVSFSWMRTDPYPAGRRDERDTSVLKAIYLF